jgi:hypothetical protein
MKVRSETIRLSASDLSNHLGCQHLTSLDLAVAVGADTNAHFGVGFQHLKLFLKMAKKRQLPVEWRRVGEAG